jgi:hypothetical protein
MNARRSFAMIVLLAGCPAVEPTGEMPGGGGVPAAVQARFDMYCQNDATCHIAGGVQAPDLSPGGSAQGIMGSSAAGMPYVTFGDVENSWLAQKLLPGTPGQMPPIGHPQPTPEDVAIILGWIAGAPFPEEETDSATGTSMPTTTMTSGMTDMGTGMEEPQLCTLEAVAPAVDPAMAVDAGDTATQIPTVIGEVLLANCGCHYTETIPMEYGGPYGGAQPMATLADFQGDWMGLIPTGFEGMPAYAAISARMDFAVPMPPPLYCGVESDPSADNTAITQADYDLLKDWLDMMAPSGADYTPP